VPYRLLFLSPIYPIRITKRTAPARMVCVDEGLAPFAVAP
jgi:hypothetical protein